MKLKTSIITEPIEITNRKGEVIKTIPVTIDLLSACDQIVKHRAALIGVQADTPHEVIGRITISLFTAVFGEKVVHELLEHYSDSYEAMFADITPYLAEIVFPAIEEIRKRGIEAKKALKN